MLELLVIFFTGAAPAPTDTTQAAVSGAAASTSDTTVVVKDVTIPAHLIGGVPQDAPKHVAVVEK